MSREPIFENYAVWTLETVIFGETFTILAVPNLRNRFWLCKTESMMKECFQILAHNSFLSWVKSFYFFSFVFVKEIMVLGRIAGTLIPSRKLDSHRKGQYPIEILRFNAPNAACQLRKSLPCESLFRFLPREWRSWPSVAREMIPISLFIYRFRFPTLSCWKTISRSSILSPTPSPWSQNVLLEEK